MPFTPTARPLVPRTILALAALVVALLAPTVPAAHAGPKELADQIMRKDYRSFLDYKRTQRPAPFDWSDDGCSPPTPPHMRNLFNGPCQMHDFGYRNYGRGLQLGRNDGTRRWIDQRLLEESRRLCDTTFTRWWQRANRDQCHREANAMWAAVRAGGSSAFYG